MTERRLSTRIVHTRLDRMEPETVNPPVEHASTVLIRDPARLYGTKPTYGRMGLTVHRELEAALCTLEHATHAALTVNGLAANALAIAALVSSGDHILISDNLYGPTRRFCQRRLARMGVEVTAFSPRIGEGLGELIRPNTRAVYLESPGSLTFEVHDTPAIVEVSRARGLRTVMDNTWSAGVFHKPLDLGVDLSVQALTKYAVGHADAFGGAVMSRDPEVAKQVEACAEDWGSALGPDDAYRALRGLRTLSTRLAQHEASALTLADWLRTRPEVAEVLHPALPAHPDHALWRRDFTGSSGLFGLVLHPQPDGAVARFLGALQLFGMGFSWGGFESLILPCDPQLRRQTGDWTDHRAGPLIRIHAGLEAVEDLLADLDAAMSAHLVSPG